jgi:hypothetical protein
MPKEYLRNLGKSAIAAFLLKKIVDKNKSVESYILAATGAAISRRLNPKDATSVLALSFFPILRRQHRDLFITYFALKKVFPKSLDKHMVYLYTVFGTVLYYLSFRCQDDINPGTLGFLRKHMHLSTGQFCQLRDVLNGDCDELTTCDVFHPNKCCKQHLFDCYTSSFRDFLKLFGTLHFTTRFMSNKPVICKGYVKDVLQSTVFLTTAFWSALSASCFWRNHVSRKIDLKKTSLLWLIVGASLNLESPKRKKSVTLFYIANVLYPLVARFKLASALTAFV